MGLIDNFLKKISDKDLSGLINVVKSTELKTSSYQNDIVPIEVRMAGYEPKCDGLYPHEVLILSYAPKCCESENNFAKFWWYKYGIKDVKAVLIKLKKNGYIESGNIYDAINMYNASKIKEELQSRGLKVSGNKRELIDTLVNNVNENELKSIFKKVPYKLTDMGQALLEKYEWIPYIHSHSIEDLDIWNLTDLVMTPPYNKYRDKIWGYLNKCTMIHIKNNDWGLYRNTRFEMSEFLAEEGKIKQALMVLNFVIEIDLSGLSNGFNIEYLNYQNNSYFPYETSTAIMAPGIKERIKKYKSILGMDNEELKELLYKAPSDTLPFRLFTEEECADIVIYEIEDNRDALIQIYKNAEMRYKRRFK